jgi:hypothetical protein
MTEDAGHNQAGGKPPEERRSIWQRFRSWWTKPPTALATLLLGLAGFVLAAVLSLVASILLHFFGASGSVSGYVLIATIAVSLMVGGVSALWATAKYFRVRVQAAEAEREREQAKLAELATDHEALRRLGIYHDHLYNLIDSLIAGDLSLSDLGSEETSQAICGAAERQLQDGTGENCCVSLWMEDSGSVVREKIQGAVNKWVPAVEIGNVFKIVADLGLKPPEKKAFEVDVDSSWLNYRLRIERGRGEAEVFEEDHLEEVHRGSPDLEAFKSCGFRSVRAVSFQREGQTGYLVALSTDANPFSIVEGSYLLWLRHAIELDEAIRGASS